MGPAPSTTSNIVPFAFLTLFPLIVIGAPLAADVLLGGGGADKSLDL
jgi:hypothetical protein